MANYNNSRVGDRKYFTQNKVKLKLRAVLSDIRDTSILCETNVKRIYPYTLTYGARTTVELSHGTFTVQ